MTENRDKALYVYLSKAELDQVTAAAEAVGLSASAFVRNVALVSVRALLAQNNILEWEDQ